MGTLHHLIQWYPWKRVVLLGIHTIKYYVKSYIRMEYACPFNQKSKHSRPDLKRMTIWAAWMLPQHTVRLEAYPPRRGLPHKAVRGKVEASWLARGLRPHTSAPRPRALYRSGVHRTPNVNLGLPRATVGCAWQSCQIDSHCHCCQVPPPPQRRTESSAARGSGRRTPPVSVTFPKINARGRWPILLSKSNHCLHG